MPLCYNKNTIMSNIDSKIFKAYDVRGVYPDEVNEDVAYKIGQALMVFLDNTGQAGQRQILVGRDARESSPDLAEALMQGLMSQGADIIDIGEVSTPLFYWALIRESSAGGVMITASHNPAQYNGFKVCGAGGRSIGLDNGLAKIRDIAMGADAGIKPALGRVVKKELLKEYTDFILKKFDIKKFKPLKLAIDCGNSIVGPELTALLKRLPFQAELLFVEPDGRFPNHEANPSKEETLVVLKEKVLSSGAALGVAFDGDADRVAFLDEKGEVVRGDFITSLLAEELLKNDRGQKIFYEVRSSRIVPETIKTAGGQPVLGRPGHTLIKEQMRRENILFGGEMSGHYFYRELGFIENSLFTMLNILLILSERDKPFSALASPLKKYFTSGEINFTVADADKTLSEIEKRYSGAQIKKVDGLTVEFPDWWFNLRKSNTEPLVRLNAEADTAALLEEKKREVVALIR